MYEIIYTACSCLSCYSLCWYSANTYSIEYLSIHNQISDFQTCHFLFSIVSLMSSCSLVRYPRGRSSHQRGVNRGRQSDPPHLPSLDLLLFSSPSLSNRVDECATYACSWQSWCNFGADCFFRTRNSLHMEGRDETAQRLQPADWLPR